MFSVKFVPLVETTPEVNSPPPSPALPGAPNPPPNSSPPAPAVPVLLCSRLVSPPLIRTVEPPAE